MRQQSVLGADKNDDKLIEERWITFSAATIYDDYMWFFSDYENFFMKISMADWKVSYAEISSGYNPSSERADQILCDDKYIYKLEFSHSLKIISWDERVCEEIQFGINFDRSWGNYAVACINQKSLYIFPRIFPGIIRVDIEKKKVDQISKLYIDFVNNYTKRTKGVIFQSGIVDQDTVFLFSCHTNHVVKYNIPENIYCYLSYPGETKNLITVKMFQGEIYLLFEGWRLYRWRPGAGEKELIWEQMEDGKNEIGDFVVCDKQIYCLPSLGDKIYCIDRLTGKCDVFNEYPIGFQYISHPLWAKYLNCVEDMTRYYFPLRSANYILSICKVSGEVQWIKPIRFKETDRMTYYFEKRYGYREAKDSRITDYIHMIKSLK